MTSQKPSESSRNRRGERGAALITAVLLSLLLLAAGGALILTTSMAGVTAIDSTAEMQAYYAAEAGVARTLEVLRGNVQSNPAGTRATFKNVVCTRGRWNSLSGNAVNVAPNGSSVFRVTSVVDPDNLASSVLAPDDLASPCTSASYKPLRLRIRVTGIGPRNARKNMEVVVNRYTLNYPVNATLTAPNGSGTPMPFNLGDSNVTSLSGVDAANSGSPPIAPVAVDNADYNTTNNVIDGCHPDGTNCSGSGPVVDPPDPTVLTDTNKPSFLKSVDTARQFLYGNEGMMAAAINQGRYFTSGTAALNSYGGIGASDPQFTFVDSDMTLGPGSPTGQGTLIVTGTLTLNGNFNFNGVIMVLGAGRVLRSGGGHGNIYGAIFIAKFNRTGSSSDVFDAPTFDISGGGTSNIQYNTFAIDQAKSVGGHSVGGIREY
jgi:hypothetical protein